MSFIPDLSLLKSDGYQPSAFYFKVVLSATAGLTDTSFQEVSGLSSEIGTEDLVEGGENRYVHKLPTAVKHPNLKLKRGIAKISSPLVLWCKTTLEADFALPIVTMPILIYLMNEEKLPIRIWSVTNGYPVKWEIDVFNSTKNEVAIENIEVAYNAIYRMF